MRDIAKIAGVSARTVFQHFADTAELYVAVLGRVLAARRRPARAGRQLAARPTHRRVVDQRAERYERLLPMWTFFETLQRRSSEAADMVRRSMPPTASSLRAGSGASCRRCRRQAASAR